MPGSNTKKRSRCPNGTRKNPKTGELIYIPKKNKVRFRASKKFKEFLNQ